MYRSLFTRSLDTASSLSCCCHALHRCRSHVRGGGSGPILTWLKSAFNDRKFYSKENVEITLSLAPTPHADARCSRRPAHGSITCRRQIAGARTAEIDWRAPQLPTRPSIITQGAARQEPRVRVLRIRPPRCPLWTHYHQPLTARFSPTR